MPAHMSFADVLRVPIGFIAANTMGLMQQARGGRHHYFVSPAMIWRIMKRDSDSRTRDCRSHAQFRTELDHFDPARNGANATVTMTSMGPSVASNLVVDPQEWLMHLAPGTLMDQTVQAAFQLEPNLVVSLVRHKKESNRLKRIEVTHPGHKPEFIWMDV